MADKMMRMAGRDQNGLARAIQTDEFGNIGIKVTSSNNTLLTSELKNGASVELMPSKHRATMFSVYGGGTGVSGQLFLDHFVKGIGWLPWNDAEGNRVVVPFNGDGVYGPFQSFPHFEKGRITLDLTAGGTTLMDISKGKVYAASSVRADGVSDPQNAFDGNATSRWAGVGATNEWVAVDVGEAVKVVTLKIQGRDASWAIANFKLQGTNTSLTAPNAEWIDLRQGTVLRQDSKQTWSITTPNAYRYYRLLGADIQNPVAQNPSLSVYDIELLAPTDPTIKVQVQGVM